MFENKVANLMNNGCWKELAYNLEVEFLETGNDKVIQKIIYDKSYRPACVSDQMWLLKEIHFFKELSLCHRLNAATAYSHKAMESLDFIEVRDAASTIEKNLDKIEEVGNNKDLRKDSLHIQFSMLSVLWHLYFFMGDFEAYLRVGNNALVKADALSVEKVGPAFYQTCTNVLRVLLVSYLSGLVGKDKSVCLKSISLMNNVLWLGLIVSDDHKVKFKEYLEITKLYHELNRFESSFFSVFVNEPPSKKGVETVIKRSMRPHGREKMLHMRKMMDRFYDEMWG